MIFLHLFLENAIRKATLTHVKYQVYVNGGDVPVDGGFLDTL